MSSVRTRHLAVRSSSSVRAIEEPCCEVLQECCERMLKKHKYTQVEVVIAGSCQPRDFVRPDFPPVIPTYCRLDVVFHVIVDLETS